MPVSLDDFVRKGERQIETDVGDETLLMMVESGRYFSMDGVAREIWAGIGEATSVRAIIEKQIENFEVDPLRAEAEILALLNDLLEHGLIECVQDPTA